MLHYVRGDGGQVMIPKEELQRWLKAERASVNAVKHVEYAYYCVPLLDGLLAELEAMGK